MLETFAALLCAHVAADFLVQTRWMAGRKGQDWRAMVAHIVCVLALAILFTGALAWLALFVIGVSHVVIDLAKARGMLDRAGRFGAFCIDQAAHLAFVFMAALVSPEAFHQGVWATPPEAIKAFTLPITASQGLEGWLIAAGFLVAVRAGRFALDALMKDVTNDVRPSPAPEQKRAAIADSVTDHNPIDTGLVNGGAYIGFFERALTFAFVMTGAFEGVGFLLAAKSILRFQYAKERSASEQVIIGTLASIGWALGAGLGVRALLHAV